MSPSSNPPSDPESHDLFLKRWQLQLRKGLLVYLVLAVLSEGESYGYRLISSLGDYLGSDMAEGTIYPLLSRLQRQGLIESRWQIMDSGPARKYYSIKPGGREVLAAMKDRWEQIHQLLKRVSTP
ncbi:MAG: PadR family transcriptional regulator [Thermoanaerobaculia bacterium]|nr:PadR family transcriptional regulator [Thermoanaerobaculia bacterium]